MGGALNCAGDKVGVVLQPCAAERRSRIALTRHNGRGVTSLPLYMSAREHRFLVTHAGWGRLPSGSDVALLECFDPVWQRKAWSARGLIRLFGEVLETLERL